MRAERCSVRARAEEQRAAPRASPPNSALPTFHSTGPRSPGAGGTLPSCRGAWLPWQAVSRTCDGRAAGVMARLNCRASKKSKTKGNKPDSLVWLLHCLPKLLVIKG